jgi:hypothetical protein
MLFFSNMNSGCAAVQPLYFLGSCELCRRDVFHYQHSKEVWYVCMYVLQFYFIFYCR